MNESFAIPPYDEHNRHLVAQVRPADWINPHPESRYNLVVLGAGTAGLISAAGAAGLGARVALVERAWMGGDCLNVGCVPSKALLRAARACAEVRQGPTFGLSLPQNPLPDFGTIMERMRRLRASISPNDAAARYRSLGVDVFFGQGRFSGPDTLEVDGVPLRFHRAILATGARASTPEIPGLAEAGYYTNENIFTLTSLPQRLAVIGAGPIGCELSQAFARFGAQVTLITSTPRVLMREEAEAAAVIEKALQRDGIDIVRETTVTRAEKQGALITLQLTRAGQNENRTFEAVLVGVGRTPNVTGLGLEAAGVTYDPLHGVVVNDRLRTSNPRIYAAGDVASRYQFTHAADAMARIAIQNALFYGRARLSHCVIPRCTYTDPEIAHVGLSLEEAKEQRIDVDTLTQEMAHIDRAVLDGDTDGFVRIHVRRGTDRIVGATLVARHAGEMISEVSLAMTGNLGLRTLARTIHPYPTQAEALKRVADAYNRTRLKPWIRQLFVRWFRWFR